MTDFSLSYLDIAIIVGYVGVTIVVGLRYAGHPDDSESYFLAGRQMIWPVVGISLFASNISSTTMIGLAGDAYGRSISVFNYEWMAAVILVFFAVFFLPFYLHSRIYTLPEFLERRFSAASRYYFSVITIVANIIIDTAGGLYAGGLVLQLMFPDVPLWLMVAILAGVAGSYTIVGGLAAVMITDVMQTAILMLGSLLVSWIAWMKIEALGGWDVVAAAAVAKNGDGALSLWQPLSDPNMPWLGLLTGVPLLGFYFWCTNQFMVQRVLSAKSVLHGQWGSLFAGLLKLPVLFLMVLPGAFAIVLLPDLPRQDQVFPTLIFTLLPPGLRGLVIAGLVAALLSSIDSTLNSASTLVTMDFAYKLKPDLSPAQLARVGRITTFSMMVLAVLWAPLIARVGSLFQYLQIVLSYMTPPVMALFLLGLFWKRANASGATWALGVGFVVGTGLLVGNFAGWLPPGLHFLYVAALLFALSSVTLVVASLLTDPPPPEKTEGFTWTLAHYQAETLELAALPWWQNYRTLGVALVVLTALVIGPFL